MRFPIIGSTVGAPSTSVVNYNHITTASLNWGTNETQKAIPVTEAFDLKTFFVECVAPGGSASRTWVVRKNNADTSASITITGANTSGSWSGTVSFAAGDTISLASTPTSTPAASAINRWALDCETTGNKAIMLAGIFAVTAATPSISYISPNVSGAHSTNATDQEIIVPCAGTITKLISKTDGTPTIAGSFSVSLRLNNSSDNLTVSLTNAAQQASATGSVAVSAGDKIVIKMEPIGAPTARRLFTSITFEPTIAGETIASNSSGSNPATNVTNYNYGTGPGGTLTWSATETARLSCLPAGYYLKKMYVELSAAPTTGRSRTITIRKGLASTPISVLISDAATTGNDTSNISSISTNGETLGIMSQVSSTPAASLVKVCYVLTAVGAVPISEGNFFLMF